MWNRHKTLLRDHSVPEVTLKACPRHYSVSAVPETLTVGGPKRPPKTSRVNNPLMYERDYVTRMKTHGSKSICQFIVFKDEFS